ncbi:CLUMA_CG019791, isoform A [Clunio marinus]|uniref:CLUMA_CG019791, isoform A n=1 Tax=Clunio marinus TaxID=568069 RepID=A0A1J1J524_9DIPT|nr:CLUMA_CG019791, isoform A [Clunio marinus]
MSLIIHKQAEFSTLSLAEKNLSNPFYTAALLLSVVSVMHTFEGHFNDANMRTSDMTLHHQMIEFRIQAKHRRVYHDLN